MLHADAAVDHGKEGGSSTYTQTSLEITGFHVSVVWGF